MNKPKNVITLPTVLFLILICGCTVYSNYTAKIEIGSDINSYILTTSVSKLKLYIPDNLMPKESQIAEGGTKNPRYFIFTDKYANLILSGWFEPNYIYPGMEKFFYEMTKKWGTDGHPPMPENVNFVKHNDWSVTSYDMTYRNCYTPNIQAHFLKDNTWIHLHISYKCGSGKKVEDLINFLDTIRIVSK